MREYAVVLLAAALVTFLATPVVRVAAVRFRVMAAVRDRDVHVIPTPRGGGVAMYLGVAAGVLVASRLPSLQRSFEFSTQTVAVLVAGGLICLLGVLDDRFGLDALTKLTGQIAAAGVMVLLGVQLPSSSCRSPTSARCRWARRRRPGDHPAHRADGQRAQLHRRPGRARGRRLGDRGAGLLRLQLPPGPGRLRRRRQRPGADHRGARRRLPGLPAAQLQPRPDLHGRLRLDAGRADAVRGSGVGHRAGRLRRRSARRPACSR